MSEHYVVVAANLNVEVDYEEECVLTPAKVNSVSVFTEYTEASLDARRCGGQLWHIQGHVSRRLS